MSSEKKKQSDNLFILILIFVILGSFAFILNTKFAELNKIIDTLSANEENLRAENQRLLIQLEKNSFYNEIILQNNMLNIPIEKKDAKLFYPKNNFVAAEKDFSNKTLANKNILYMNKIQNHGTDITFQYVSAEMDDIKNKAVIYYIEKLSNDICANHKTDYDKAYAIALWVSENICYNYDDANAGIDFDTISLETTLALRRTTCAGYSNLFSALCEAQGIYCVNLRGCGNVGLCECDDWDKQPINHEWNAVYCKDTWYFVDTTWASNNSYSNGIEYFYDTINTQYLMMDFYTMSNDHRIDISDHREFLDTYK